MARGRGGGGAALWNSVGALFPERQLSHRIVSTIANLQGIYPIMVTSKRSAPRKTAAKSAPAPAAKVASPADAPVVATAAPTASRIPAPTLKPGPVTVPTVSVVTGSVAADADEPVVMKKKELFDRVVAASGAKKKDVKPIVEATLKVLGDALSNGEELILPPFGKMKINRQREDNNGEMLILKLRRNEKFGGSGSSGNDGLEEDSEDE